MGDIGERSFGAQGDRSISDPEGMIENADLAGQSETPAEKLFAVVLSEIARLTRRPINEAQVAENLNVTKPQAKAWLTRLVEEVIFKKIKKPVGYVACKRQLL